MADGAENNPVEPSLSVVVVSHDSAGELPRTLPAIAAQLREGDELIVCDNASSDGSAALARELTPDAEVIETGGNLGFGAACNAGAELARGDLLLFLNPDAVVAEGFREAIELPLREGRDWAAWQGLVTDGAGRVNTWGGEVHYTGIAWAGGAGRDPAEAPREPREIVFASGACLAVRADPWRRLGGFDPSYFLYHEDTELGLRLWLGGERVGIEPRARCEHSYEFVKGPQKWFYLERNRWATILRCYPRRLLLLLLPALLATELGLHLASIQAGWARQKLRADRAAIAALPRLLDERRRIQGAARDLGAREFAELLGPRLGSAYLGRAADSRLLARLLAAYWRAVLALL